MTLQQDAMISLTNGEISRLESRQERRSDRRSRSQGLGKISGYDADQGHAIVTSTQGTLYAKSISTSSTLSVAVSLPARQGVGSIDSKPVVNTQ